MHRSHRVSDFVCDVCGHLPYGIQPVEPGNILFQGLSVGNVAQDCLKTRTGPILIKDRDSGLFNPSHRVIAPDYSHDQRSTRNGYRVTNQVFDNGVITGMNQSKQQVGRLVIIVTTITCQGSNSGAYIVKSLGG